MVAQFETLQRIARLTPLAEVLGLIETLGRPIAPQQVRVAQAFGLVLAADAVAPSPRPETALALRDGWALRADDLTDASAYGPIPLTPPPVWRDVGEPLPAGMDAVAPVDAVIWRDQIAEAIAPVGPGEGVLAKGADAAAGAVLRPAGARLRRSDLAVLTAAGIDSVSVRVPRIRIVGAYANGILEAIVGMLAGVVVTDGGVAGVQSDSAADWLDRALRDDAADAVIVVGGTGGGRRDASVRALARQGKVAVHGIAIAPGETAALGHVGNRPVLLIPGRIDAALAVWPLIGRPLLAGLAGGTAEPAGFDAALSRKVTSRLGLAEVVLVRRDGDGVTPLASDYLPLAALAAADGWILVAADSEGYPAGARVTVRPLP